MTNQADDTTPPPDEAPTSTTSRERRRWWRIARVAVPVIVVLVAIFYLGGGWYLSGQIYSGALHIDPSTVEMDLRVVHTGPGVITLRETGASERGLHVDELWGVEWAGGYGQLSGPPTAKGADVTRRLTVLAGSPPEAGERAGLSRDAFPDDPSVAIGRPVQQVSYRSPLGAMPAWYVPGTSSTWAVLVHGWTATRTEMLRMMRDTVSAGLPSLDITYRNDRGVPQDPSHQYQYGRTEWRDLDAAVAYAQSHGARGVVLFGASMGGGIVASFLEHSTRRSFVRAIALDAPMLSFSRTVDLAASQRSLPLIGLPLPGSLVWVGKRFATLRYDVDWDATDYLRDTRWDTLPTLIFHGDADTRVPLSGSTELARKEASHVQLVVVHGAGHVESWNHDPASYDRTLASFLRAGAP